MWNAYGYKSAEFSNIDSPDIMIKNADGVLVYKAEYPSTEHAIY